MISRFRSSTYYSFKGFCLGRQLSVLVIGSGMPCRFYPRLLGSNSLPEIKTVRNFNIPKLLSSADAEVMIFHAQDHLVPASLGAVALPEYVNMELPLNDTFDKYVKSLKKSARNDVSKAGKSGFKFEISKDPADLEDFYSNLYVPTTLSRYREDAYIYPKAYVRNFFKNGFLLTLSNGDGPFLAANLVRKMKNHLWVKFSGIRNGSDHIRRLGTNTALIIETIRQAYESGHTHIDFGISLPFRADSAFVFKEKWGNQTHLPPFRTASVHLAFKNKEAQKLFWEQTKPVTYDDVTKSLSSKKVCQ